MGGTTTQGELKQRLFPICLSRPEHVKHEPRPPGFPPVQTAGWNTFPSRRRSKSEPFPSSEKVSGGEETALSLPAGPVCVRWRPLVCEGGPLLYEGVRLVQDSAALNGTQRVLLDQVITEEECSALKHLAHVRTPQSSMSYGCFIYQLKRVFFPPSVRL